MLSIPTFVIDGSDDVFAEDVDEAAGNAEAADP